MEKNVNVNRVLLIALLAVAVLIAGLLCANLAMGGIWIIEGLNGEDGADGVNGRDGLNGADGADGLDGTNGLNGATGKSAYEIACENGFEGSVQEWVLSLAVRGHDGADGIGIRDIRIDADGNLLITLTDGRFLNVGYVGGTAHGTGVPDADGFYEVLETVFLNDTVGGLKLRAKPEISEDSAVLFEISPGTELLRVGNQRVEEGFSRLIYKGQVCYARSKYFDLQHDFGNSAPAVNLPSRLAVTLGDSVMLYRDQVLENPTADVRMRCAYSGSGNCVTNGTVSFSVTPDTVGEETLVVGIEFYTDGAWRTVDEHAIPVTVVAPAALLSQTGAVLGDDALAAILAERLTLMGDSSSEIPAFAVLRMDASNGYNKTAVQALSAQVAALQALAEAEGKTVPILVLSEPLPPSGTDDPALAATRADLLACISYLEQAFGGREDEGIYLLPNFACVGDGDRAADGVSMSEHGYEKTVDIICAYLNWLFA